MIAGEAQVLVVDDQIGSDRLFADAFGDRLTTCASVRDLERLLSRDDTSWDVAFVDFYLRGMTDDQRTGLTVLRLLRSRRPTTRLVSYTQIPESGRRLFVAVAKEWFGASAALDKSGLTVDSITRFVQAVMAGRDPSDPRITRWLAYSDVVDRLIKDERHIRLWRRWHQLGGNEGAIGQVEYLSSGEVRGFRENAYEAVLEFRERFEGVAPHELEFGRNKNYKGVLNSFASEYRAFFAAVDLEEALAGRSRGRR